MFLLYYCPEEEKLATKFPLLKIYKFFNMIETMSFEKEL